MSIGRGLLRFWLIGTVLWVAYWAYQYATNCDFTAGLVVCKPNSILFDRFWSAGLVHNRNNDPWQTYWDLIECLIEIPIFVLAVGIVAKWAIRGFRSDP
jgi:hypothetical protein